MDIKFEVFKSKYNYDEVLEKIEYIINNVLQYDYETHTGSMSDITTVTIETQNKELKIQKLEYEIVDFFTKSLFIDYKFYNLNRNIKRKLKYLINILKKQQVFKDEVNKYNL